MAPAGVGTEGLGSVVAERPAASAVWFGGAMGLLDDAIREHLELKRRRGADAAEVAREERAALEPVLDHDGAPAGEEDVHADALPAEDFERYEESHEAAHAPPPAAAPEEGAVWHDGDADHRLGDISTGAQETAELDMQAVLHDEHAGPPEQVPGQERLSFE